MCLVMFQNLNIGGYMDSKCNLKINYIPLSYIY